MPDVSDNINTVFVISCYRLWVPSALPKGRDPISCALSDMCIRNMALFVTPI